MTPLYPITHEQYIVLIRALHSKIDSLETDVQNIRSRDKQNEFTRNAIERRYEQIYKLQNLLIELKLRHDSL